MTDVVPAPAADTCDAPPADRHLLLDELAAWLERFRIFRKTDSVIGGAAVARRQIKRTVETPIAALWETIGRCGRPPRDQARQFALYAIVLTAVGWLVVPIGAAIAFALD